jgi:hypothetical protein
VELQGSSSVYGRWRPTNLYGRLDSA